MITVTDPDQWLPPAREVARILLDAGAKSVAVMAVAGVAMVCMRRRSAAARHLVWFLAVASLPALPVLAWSLPGWRVLPGWMDFRQAKPAAVQHLTKTPSLPEPSAAIPPAPSRIGTAVPATSEMALPTRVPSEAVPTVAGPRHPTDRSKLDWLRAGLSVWLAGVMFALAPAVLGWLSLCRLERASRRETAAPWLDLLGRMVGRLGFKRRVVLLKTARRRVPMTWGVLRPKVLLPEESQQWPEERRGVVLLHELAHVQRCDYPTHLITRLICALYWFNPLVWLAARRMVAERERACDDLVLRHGAGPADYAEHVLEVSAGLSTGWLAGCGGVAMVRASNLEGRLRAILDNRRDRAAVTRAAMVSALIASAAIIVPVAMMTAAPAGEGAGAAALIVDNAGGQQSLGPPQEVPLQRQWVDALIATLKRETWDQSIENLVTNGNQFSDLAARASEKGAEAQLEEMLSARRAIKVLNTLQALPTNQRVQECRELFDRVFRVYADEIERRLGLGKLGPPIDELWWVPPTHALCLAMFAAAEAGQRDLLAEEFLRLDELRTRVESLIADNKTACSETARKRGFGVLEEWKTSMLFLCAPQPRFLINVLRVAVSRDPHAPANLLEKINAYLPKQGHHRNGSVDRALGCASGVV